MQYATLTVSYNIFSRIEVVFLLYKFIMLIQSVLNKRFQTKKHHKMDYKKLLVDVLVVTAGVALWSLAVKPLLDKAKVTTPSA